MMQNRDSRASRRATALLAALLLSLTAGLLSACNTISGAGQDTSAAGQAITNGAEKVKSGL
jgi:predicted small secreted protein